MKYVMSVLWCLMSLSVLASDQKANWGKHGETSGAVKNVSIQAGGISLMLSDGTDTVRDVCVHAGEDMERFWISRTHPNYPDVLAIVLDSYASRNRIKLKYKLDTCMSYKGDLTPVSAVIAMPDSVTNHAGGLLRAKSIPLVSGFYVQSLAPYPFGGSSSRFVGVTYADVTVTNGVVVKANVDGNAFDSATEELRVDSPNAANADTYIRFLLLKAAMQWNAPVAPTLKCNAMLNEGKRCRLGALMFELPVHD